MKTKAILSAAALCALTFARAQEGTTAPPAVPQQPQPELQAPAAPQQSAYHDCLVVAGTNTWTILGLDAQQQARVTDLQARYKAALNPPKEETKGKKGKEVTAKSSKTVTAPPVSTQVTTPIDKESTDPLKEKVEEGSVEASAPDPSTMPQVLSFDDELRTILTADQMALWEKQCAHSEPVGAVTP